MIEPFCLLHANNALKNSQSASVINWIDLIAKKCGYGQYHSTSLMLMMSSTEIVTKESKKAYLRKDNRKANDDHQTGRSNRWNALRHCSPSQALFAPKGERESRKKYRQQNHYPNMRLIRSKKSRLSGSLKMFDWSCRSLPYGKTWTSENRREMHIEEEKQTIQNCLHNYFFISVVKSNSCADLYTINIFSKFDCTCV